MVTIKAAERADCASIVEMVRKLAAFEHLEEQLTVTAGDIERLLFDEKVGRGLIAKWDGKPAGYCLYFYNISTFKGKKGIFIEDLFVSPEYRGSGIGTWMLQMVGRTALEEGCGRLEWTCLDWNTKAQDFYTAMGAAKHAEWQVFRVDEAGLADFSAPKCRCNNK